MKKTLVPFLSIIFCSYFSLQAQYQAGWLNDNYAGINSVVINPALPSNTPYRWDINIAGIEQFFGNNYGYLRNGSLSSFYQNRNDFSLVFEPELRGEPTDADYILDFYHEEKKRYINSQTHVMGPSIYVKINAQHHVGLFTGAHAIFGTKNIPAVFSYWEYDKRAFNQPFEVTPFMGAVMTWSEAGLNYTFKKETVSGSFAIGASVKMLQGYEAGYFELEESFNLTKLEGDSIAGNQTNIAFGYTDNIINTIPDVEVVENGNGFGFDIGAVYVASSQNSDKKYDFKIAAAINNFGSINFNKNASAHQLNSTDYIELASSDYTSYTELSDLEDAVQQFRNTVLRDNSASQPTDAFTMALPATLNLSGDFSFTPNIYLNSSFVQPLGIGKYHPAISSQLSVTPRFENRFFGGYLPFVINNWNDFNVGIAGRFGPLVIGTENVQSIFSASDFRSTEFFVALKLNPFWFSESKTKSNRGARGNGPKCYKF